MLGEIEPDQSGVELFTPHRIDICFGLAKANPTLKSKRVITRFRSKIGADPLNSSFTLGTERSKKLSDTERITFWIQSVPACNRHRNCAGPAGSNENRRPIRCGFRGASIIDPVKCEHGFRLQGRRSRI